MERVRLLDDVQEVVAENVHAAPPSARAAASSAVPQSITDTSGTAQPKSKEEDDSNPAASPAPVPPHTSRGWDSLDFSLMDSAVREAWELSRSGWEKRLKKLERWALLFSVGVGVGCIAFLITWASQHLQQIKLDIVSSQIRGEQSGDLPAGVALGTFIAICAGYGLVAAVPTAYLAPAAAGSGISEVKGYLNGISLPKVLRSLTLVVKVLGNIFALSSGAPIGAEGPMIHVGAILASGMSQGKSTVLGLDTRWSVHRHFRTDIERRDFVAAGAAAGVAAAFGAPVGGVLLVMEEGASHWHKALTWRTFFCSVVAAYTVDFLFTGVGTPNDPATGWGALNHPGMFSFGSFQADVNAKIWSLWELPVFMAIGAAGGLLGAFFVWVSRRLLRFRAKHSPVTSPGRRVAEVLLVVALNALLKFVTPYVLGQCNPVPTQQDEINPTLVRLYCADGYYNDLATLFMSPSEETIRSLFHFTHQGAGGTGGSPFTTGRLAIFFSIYCVMATLCNGLAWPSGLFIPSLLAGSAMGRLIGQGINAIPGIMAEGAAGSLVDPGTYALVGAAALLAGTSRLTISLSAILLESTGNYIFSLPLMITILSSRVVGGAFNESIYDALIQEKRWPLLKESPPQQYKHVLRVSDVMTRHPMSVPAIVPAGTLLDMLRACSHHGFPVVHTDKLLAAHPRLGNLAGYIQRRHLAVLLTHRTFHSALPTVPFAAGSDVAADVKAGRVAAAYSIQVGGAHRRAVSSGPSGGRGVDVRSRRHLSYSDRRPEGSLSRAVTLRMPSVPSMTVDALMESAGAGAGAGAGGRGRADSAAKGRERVSSGTRPLWESSRFSSSGLQLSALHPRGSDAADGLGEEEGIHGTGRPPAPSAGSDRQVLGEEADAVELAYQDEPLLSWQVLEAHYPHYPPVDGLELTPTERAMFVDLRPYMDPCPVTVSVHAPLQRAHQLFRGCGLRHLLVTNDCHDVVGIIARQDLVDSGLDKKMAVKMQRREQQASLWDTFLVSVRGTAEAVSEVLRIPISAPQAGALDAARRSSRSQPGRQQVTLDDAGQARR